MSDLDCNCGAHSGDPEHLTMCPMHKRHRRVEPEGPVTLLDTPEGRKAVEAVMDGALPGLRGHNRDTSLPLFEKGLTAALPHLRRMLAEELREKVKFLRGRPTKSALSAWYDAADFLERGDK